jgi:hypothetical protein
MPGLQKDETGHHYGRLTVLEFSHLNKHHCAMWLCECGCGQQCVVLGSALRRGVTQSCGCLHDQKASARMGVMNEARWHAH